MSFTYDPILFSGLVPAGTGGGANQSLSNLTNPTTINQDLNLSGHSLHQVTSISGPTGTFSPYSYDFDGVNVVENTFIVAGVGGGIAGGIYFWPAADGSTLPAPMVPFTTYYASVVDANSWTLFTDPGYTIPLILTAGGTGTMGFTNPDVAIPGSVDASVIDTVNNWFLATGPAPGDALIFTAGTLPSALSLNVPYYVSIVDSGNAYQLYTDIGLTHIVTLTGDGSGSLTYTDYSTTNSAFVMQAVANVDLTNNWILDAGLSFPDGTPISFSSVSLLPTPLNAGTVYYLKNVDSGNAFQIYNDIGLTSLVTLTSAGAGPVTLNAETTPTDETSINVGTRQLIGPDGSTVMLDYSTLGTIDMLSDKLTFTTTNEGGGVYDITVSTGDLADPLTINPKGDLYLGTQGAQSNTVWIDAGVLNANAAEILNASAIGIGTSSPNSPLNIVNTSNGAEVVALSLSNLSDAANTAIDIDFQPHSSGMTLARIQANRDAYNYAPTHLAFYTFNDTPPYTGLSEQMRIDPDGNVGIGTTAPAARLHVHGNPGQNLLVGGYSNISGSTPIASVNDAVNLNTPLEIQCNEVDIMPTAGVSSPLKLYNGYLQYAGFQAAPMAVEDVIWSLPQTDGSAGQVLTTDGATNLSWSTAITGTVSIAQGGTGQTTKANAFNALAPTTSGGDLIWYDSGIGGNDRLPIGSPNTVLTVVAGYPSWQPVPTIIPSGNTASRPSSPAAGQTYLDLTLNIPIWFNGTNWINASGTSV
jgi:hypothetical protein